jgi:hypothetical protein
VVTELVRVIAFREVARTALTDELVFEPFHVRDELINGMSAEKYSFIYMEILINYREELIFL